MILTHLTSLTFTYSVNYSDVSWNPRNPESRNPDRMQSPVSPKKLRLHAHRRDFLKYTRFTVDTQLTWGTAPPCLDDGPPWRHT